MYQPLHAFRPFSESIFGSYPHDHVLLSGSTGAVLPSPAFVLPRPDPSPPTTPSPPTPPSGAASPPKSKDLGFGIDRILRGTAACEHSEDVSRSSPPTAESTRVPGVFPSPTGVVPTSFPFHPYLQRPLHPAHHTRMDQQRNYLAFCLSHHHRSGLHPVLGNLALTQRLNAASHHSTGMQSIHDGDAAGTSSSKRKRTWSRAVFSNLQRKGLEKRFDVQKYVTKPDRRQLASLLGLTDAQVKVWFQNRRMKWRHQMESKKKEEKSKTKENKEKEKKESTSTEKKESTSNEKKNSTSSSSST